MGETFYYVGGAPYFTRSAAILAAKGTGLPIVPVTVCDQCSGNGSKAGIKCASCNGTGEAGNK